MEPGGGPSNAQAAARPIMPSDGLEQWPPGEGADIAPESPDGLEDYEKLVDLRGDFSNPEALIEALEEMEKVLASTARTNGPS